MTLDEAIKHCEEVADGMTEQGKCIECARDHKQLAEWLTDYKRLLEREAVLDKIRAEIGMYEADCRLQGGTDECEKCNSNIFGSIYRIIDKYRVESEE